MSNYTPEEFKRKLERWAKDNPKAVERGLKAGAELVRAEAVAKHLSGPKMPRGKGSLKAATLARGSGDLAGSINTKVKVGTKISAQIGTNLKYARIHENGGTIKPKTGQFLKFNIGGRDIFAKSVTIPKRPFLKPSLEAKRKEAVDLILDKIMEAYRKA
jgi:phage gpG-like protein